MQEKLIISSTLNKTFFVLTRICMFILPFLTILLFYLANESKQIDWHKNYARSFYSGVMIWPSYTDYVEFWLAIFCIVAFLFLIILNVLAKKEELTITNVRVYGRTAFGKRVDLPIDSITAVATSLFSGIAITSASGSIRFYLIKNRDELYHAINNLLIERQDKKSSNIITQSVSNADELRKYKDLLDNGIITQEEFDAKKKQLLGL